MSREARPRPRPPGLVYWGAHSVEALLKARPAQITELLVEEGRFTEATVHLERALASDPRYSAALLALGRAHEGAEDLSSARETYRRGVEVAASKGDLATANKMQERLAALDDTSPDS